MMNKKRLISAALRTAKFLVALFLLVAFFGMLSSLVIVLSMIYEAIGMIFSIILGLFVFVFMIFALAWATDTTKR